jgi:hypothetical protein
LDDEEEAKHFTKLVYDEKLVSISEQNDDTESRQKEKLERDMIICNRAAAFHKAYDFWKERLGHGLYDFPPLPMVPIALSKTLEYRAVWFRFEWLRNRKENKRLTLSHYNSNEAESSSHEMCSNFLGMLLMAHTLSGNVLDLVGGRRIARFTNGATGIVPSNSCPKDVFLINSDMLIGLFPIVLRPLADDIDSKFNEQIYEKLKVSSDMTVLHFTVIGEG